MGLDLKEKPPHKSWEWFCLAFAVFCPFFSLDVYSADLTPLQISFRKPPQYGIGKCVLPCGDTYCGDWLNGKPEGFGTFSD